MDREEMKRRLLALREKAGDDAETMRVLEAMLANGYDITIEDLGKYGAELAGLCKKAGDGDGP